MNQSLINQVNQSISQSIFNLLSIFSFKKHDFVDIVFTLMLVYKKQSLGVQEFSQIMQYLLPAYSTDIIEEEFNYDLLKVTENKLSDIFADHVQIINKATNISESLINHVYVKKTLRRIFH